MITCNYCEDTFQDYAVMPFIKHLSESHDVKPPLCLGDHGKCTTPPRPIWPATEEYWRVTEGVR